ncbi:MAG TPA: YCF48-related protein [Candidatus Eisenbacteria bacterium]|nr:YCF48-related protein [Candidatus Eisenbacteria bacterium]
MKKASVWAVAVASAVQLVAAPAHALGTWQLAGWNGGGAYPVVMADPKNSGRVYLTSDVAGLWRSDDRGAKWNFRTAGLVNTHVAVLAIAPSDSNVIYVGTKAGVHKSTNAGVSWTHLASTKSILAFKRPDTYRSIAIDRLNANKVYAAAKSGTVYVTSDGGSTWGSLGTPFGSGIYVSALYLTADGKTLFASSMSGVAKCDPAVRTWSKISAMTAYDVYDMVGRGTGTSETLYVTAGSRIAYTKDRGASWSYTSAISSGVFNRLDVVTTLAGVTQILGGWVSGWNGGAYLSLNKGVTWTNVERGLKYDLVGDPTRGWSKGFGRPLSVAIDPFNPLTLYFSDFWGIFRSDDAGVTWNEKITGAPNTVATDVAVSSGGSIYVASMDNGLMKSTDGGVSYRALIPSTAYTSANYLGHVWNVLPIGTGRVVATSSPWDVAVNQVAVSTDGGSTFKLVRTGLPAARPKVNTVWDQGYARSLAADPTNSNRLYLGIDGDDGGGLYVSTNGGDSWAKSPGQPASKRIYNGLAVDPTQPSRLYWAAVGTGGGVYRSLDYGKTWSKVFSGSTYVFDLKVGKTGTVYAGADAGGPALYVSKDKGATWQLLKKFPDTSGTCEGLAVDPANSQRIAVSTVKWDDYAGGKVYLSQDGGASWSDISATLPNGSGASAMTFSGGYLYLSRYAGSAFRVSLA